MARDQRPQPGRRALGICLGAAGLAAPARGQDGRPLRILVGFPPGGGLDLIARLLAERLQSSGTRAVIVDNRAGGGGRVAAEMLAQAPGDGTTVMAAPIVVSVFFPFTHRSLAFDPLRDLAPLTKIGTFTFALVVRADHPARDLAHFATWARERGDRVNFGSLSAGTPSHFLGLMFNRAAGTALVHVPYRGSAPLQIALLAGEVEAGFDTTTSALGQLRAGRLRALAVTGAERSAALPDVPSFAEAGLAMREMAEAALWFGLYAPGRSPPAIIDRLSADMRAALEDPALSARLREMDIVPRPMTPEAFAAVIAADVRRWGPIIRASGFTVSE